MSLTPEQSQIVASWISAGDSLSDVQKKLSSELGIAMTYMDVRFLVDDLELQIVDRAPAPDASDVSKARATPDADANADTALAAEDDLPAEDAFPVGDVSLEVDAVTLLPGAIASGAVTFSDGVTGKWIVDNYGQPGFTEISQPGYRPSPEDGQEFVRLLSAELQRKGI